MKSLPSRRFSRFGVSRSAGRSGSTAEAQSEGGADTTVSASQSEVTASPSAIATDGVETSTITVTLRNASGVPLSGKTVTLSSTGSNNTIVQPGTTNGSGVATGTIASTTAEAKTITAVSEGITVTDTAAVTVSEFPTLDWFSDYSVGGTGTTTAALKDGSGGSEKWNGTITNAGGLEVVDASTEGLTDWPSDNALKVTAIEANGGFHRVTKSGLTVPGENESLWLRWYFRMEWDFGLGDNSNHPIEAPDTGAGEEWTWLGQHTASGVWHNRIRSMSNEDAFNAALSYIAGPDLARQTTYRFELQIQRLTGDEFQMHIRVYDSTNTLIASDADYVYANASGDLSDNPTFHFASGDGSNLSGLWNGLNGANGTYGSQLYAYEGCFAVSRQTWCGPYNASNG